MGSNNALVRSVPAKDPPIRGYARVLANLAEGNGRRIRVAIRGWPGAIPGQFVMVGAGAEASVNQVRDHLTVRLGIKLVPRLAELHLVSPRGKFLTERDRRRVLEVGAPDFHHLGELLRLFLERGTCGEFA